jgi:diguanylate cyclase (GGDEF)-like protein
VTFTAANETAAKFSHDPRQMLTSLQVIVYDWDLSSDAIAWGLNAAEVFGFDPAIRWPTGAAFEEALEPFEGGTRAEIVAAATEDDEGSGVLFASLYRLRLDGSRALVVDDAGRWFGAETGRPAIVHGTMRMRWDKAAMEDVPHRRSAFLSQVAQDIAESRETGRPLTLLTLAVANLAELNDELGYDAADRIMETVTVRLAGAMRRRDRLVRYSGNRFALALRGCSLAEAEIAASRLIHLIGGEPLGTARGPVAVRMAVGGATAPDHAVEAGLLLRRAEAGLGLAKRRSARPFVMYDAKLFRQASRRRRDPMLESVDILNERRIALALQPVVSAATRETAFREALLRVQSEDGRVRPAGDVVPALERAGLIHLADIRMLELVADHLASHPQERVSLNVSPVTMERSDWLPTLKAHLGARLDVASRLIVEVTETAAIREPQAMRALLDATRSLGAAVAIDDFGAGYTSFRNLRSFPVDFVKIDGAFVQNLSRSVDDRFFVRTLIELAHHLGIATVAEWVEDEESAVLLASWGAEYLQGDHCGMPDLVRGQPIRTSLVA